MYWFRSVIALVAGLVATAVVVVACLYFLFAAYMGWLVTCRGFGGWFSGCDVSDSPWLNLGFGVTAVVLVVGAILTVALTVRVLARWVSPNRAALSWDWLVAATMVLGVAAFVGVAGGVAIGEALDEPSAWQVQARQVAEQRRQDKDEMCALVSVGDFAGAHEAVLGTDYDATGLDRPLADLAVYRSGDDVRLAMNAAEHIKVACRDTTWSQIATLIEPPIPRADLDEAAAGVAATLAEVCAAADDAQFGVAQRILSDAAVLRRFEEVMNALHFRVARNGEPRIIEGWIDDIRTDWCPDLPANEELLAEWATTHRSLDGRFVVAPTRDGDPCVEARLRGVAANQVLVIGPSGVVGTGRLSGGDGVGPIDEIRCWVSTEVPIPVEIADAYRLVAGGIELASLSDSEVVASGGKFEVDVVLDPWSPIEPIRLGPRGIGGAAISRSVSPLSEFDAVLGTDHTALSTGETVTTQVVDWPLHDLSIAILPSDAGWFTMGGWEFRGSAAGDFATDEGLTVGSTVADLEAVYGNRLLWSQPRAACGTGWIFVVGDDLNPLGRIEGLLDGPPDPSSKVVRLWSGEGLRCSGAPRPAAVVASTTSTTSNPTTTLFVSSTAQPPPPPVLAAGVELLSADRSGIDLVRNSDTVTVLGGVGVSVALPDFLGGVVYQRLVERPDWLYSHELDRLVPLWPNGVEPYGIEWMPQIGGPSQILAAGDELSTIDPYRTDTTLINGVPTLLYRRITGIPQPCDAADSRDVCMWKSAHGIESRLIALNLETGEEQPLGVTNRYETYSDVSIGGSSAAVATDEPMSVAVVDIADLNALGATGHVLETIPTARMVYTPKHRCDTASVSPDPTPFLDGKQILSPDGSTLAIVEHHPPCRSVGPPTTYVVVIDVATGTELERVELDAHIVDYDGEQILVHSSDGHLVVVQPGGNTAKSASEAAVRLWIDGTPDP